MTDLVRQLNHVPLAGLMLVVALGYTAGRVAWRGFSLGPAGGTLLVALLFGSLGLSLRALYGSDDQVLTIGAFGFALFIYSVGFEAGPRFFSSLLGGPGWRFVAVGIVVNVVALGLAVGCGLLFGLGSSVTAGLLSGALTSAPTYAAAAEVCDDRAALAVTFALTYPLGLAGLVLLIQYLPRRMGDVLSSGTDPDDESDQPESRPRSPELTRAFEVDRDDAVGRALGELDLSRRTGCWITHIHRGQDVIAPDAATRLEKADHLMVRGRFDELEKFEALVGKEVYDDELRRRMPTPRRVQVHQASAIGLSLKELGLPQRHHCYVLSIERGRVALEAWPDLGLERDDVLTVVGPRDGVRRVAAELGRFERPTDETDIAVYAAGIFLGILFGSIHLRGLGIDFRIGYAAGLLGSGILLGRFRRLGPFRANVPRAARQLVRDLGILLFVAETGIRAGESSLEGLHGLLWPTLGAALLVTVLPVVSAVLVARGWFRMRPADAWGSVAGGMTSSAALVALRREADSNEPAVSYAASYAVASVLVTLAGQAVVFLMR